jgi:hypothetical protein
MSQSEDEVAPIYQDQLYSPDLMQPVVAGGIMPSAYYSPNIMHAVVEPGFQPVVYGGNGGATLSASLMVSQQPPDVVVNTGAFERLSPNAKKEYVWSRQGHQPPLQNLRWYAVYCVDACSRSSCNTAF